MFAFFRRPGAFQKTTSPDDRPDFFLLGGYHTIISCHFCWRFHRLWCCLFEQLVIHSLSQSVSSTDCRFTVSYRFSAALEQLSPSFDRAGWNGWKDPLPKYGQKIRDRQKWLSRENIISTHWLAVEWCHEQSYSFFQILKLATADRTQYVSSSSSLIAIVVVTLYELNFVCTI